jgi:uncharacterized membrane protein
MKVAHSVVINCPPAQVFAFLSDIENERRWQPDIEELRLTSPGPLRVGSTFTEVRRTMGRRFTWQMRVTAFEPDSRFCIESTSGTLPYRGCRIVEPLEGGARVTELGELELRGPLSLLAPLLGRLSRKPLEVAYRRAKAMLEAPTGGASNTRR